MSKPLPEPAAPSAPIDDEAAAASAPAAPVEPESPGALPEVPPPF
jgi:hypothetical protein